MSSEPETRRVFISYRRDDSAYPAQSICDALVARFGKDAVFFDIDSIPMGMDFHGVLNEAVSKCDLLLAVIGDQWLNARDEVGKRRLDNPDDFVRIEIEAALSRQIPVVPVLVGRATVPRPEDLPPTLVGLSRRQATEFRPGCDFHGDLERLVRGVEGVFEEKGLQLPETITNSIGMELVPIRAGAFFMGSPDSDQTAGNNEKPQHRVEITKSFYLSEHPVKQHEYDSVIGSDPSRPKGEASRPVDFVSWYYAAAFCNRLSEREGTPPYYKIEWESVSILDGNGYRLPTEAEWEYACRAGTTTKWSFGDDESKLAEFAWYQNNSDRNIPSVGVKKPNPWGLFHMHGSVWEWCWDWYARYEPVSCVDPIGPSQGKGRVLRGGAFDSEAKYVRSAFRKGEDPLIWEGNHGFRLARTYP